MKKLNLSLIAKTFLRPFCLDNLLKSIDEYQRLKQIQFTEVIIIDDSDDENQKLNRQIVQKYKDVPVKLHQFPFNSLALSKGRNTALALTKTPYFLLCDDDMLLDKECDLEYNLGVCEKNNLDVLSGYYKNVNAADATHYSIGNWIGFIQENEEYDVVTIYENLLPNLMKCDIAQNFFIGRTQSVKKIGFPEDLPVLEHNIFFLRLKQAGLNVATTNKLFVRHFHIHTKKYTAQRNRVVINPIQKSVIGTLVSDNIIYKFNDYLHTAGQKFVPQSPLMIKYKNAKRSIRQTIKKIKAMF